MILGYNISPLPFYDSVEEQFENHPCAFGVNYPLLCGVNDPLPFLFYTDDDPDASSINSVSLVRVNSMGIDVTTDFTQGGLVIFDADVQGRASSFIRFAPNQDFLFEFPAVGLYYFIIGIFNRKQQTTAYYYSEKFCVTDNLWDAININYTSPVNLSTPFGDIPFRHNDVGDFGFRVWLNALIGKPEYTFEEVETNRTGYSFLERCTSKKTYQFNVIAPEYLCDALRLIKLCPIVKIVHRGKIYEPTSFDMNVSWEEQGDLASLRATFDTDNVITAIGGYQS